MSTRRHSRRQASVDYPKYPPQSSQQIQQIQPTQQTQQHLPIPLGLPIPNPHFHHNLPVSDYESDSAFAYLSDHPPPHHQPTLPQAPVPLRTVDELNLSVLRRHNPSITRILSVAPYAVIYTFTPHPEPSWLKSGVEGSLFICGLTPGELGETRFAAIVLNRRGMENFETELREDVASGSGVECTDEYIIVTGAKGNDDGPPTATGIWVFSEGPGSSTAATRDLIASFIKERAVEAGQSRRAAENAAAAMRPWNNNNNGPGPAHGFYQGADGFGAPMGRTISLQEMLGQQRRDDDEWSVKMHSPVGDQQQQTSRQAGPGVGRASKQAQQGPRRVGQQGQGQAQPAGIRNEGQSSQQHHLQNLFANAGLSRQNLPSLT